MVYNLNIAGLLYQVKAKIHNSCNTETQYNFIAFFNKTLHGWLLRHLINIPTERQNTSCYLCPLSPKHRVSEASSFRLTTILKWGWGAGREREAIEVYSVCYE